MTVGRLFRDICSSDVAPGACAVFDYYGLPDRARTTAITRARISAVEPAEIVTTIRTGPMGYDCA